jgi:hypothetical protein
VLYIYLDIKAYMPYKFKGKRKCKQSNGEIGSYLTIKPNGNRKCYKSKKGYNIAMAIAHEGFKMNLNLLRELISEVIHEIEASPLNESTIINIFGTNENAPKVPGTYRNESKETTPRYESFRIYKDENGSPILDRDGNKINPMVTKKETTFFYWHPDSKITLTPEKFEIALLNKVPRLGKLSPEEVRALSEKKIPTGMEITQSQFDSNQKARMARTGPNGEWELYGQWKTNRDSKMSSNMSAPHPVSASSRMQSPAAPAHRERTLPQTTMPATPQRSTPASPGGPATVIRRRGSSITPIR